MTCTALIATTINSLSIGSKYYSFTSSEAVPFALAAGGSFTLAVTFNLTGYSANGADGTISLAPGSKSGAVSITTDNSVAEFASSQSISLTGDAVTDGSYPSVNPLQVDFTAVVVTNTTSGPISNGASYNTFILSNLGETELEVMGYAYTNTDPSDDDTQFTNLTVNGNETLVDSNGYFTTTELPALQSSIAAGNSLTIEVSFNTNILGDYFTILCIWTNGGMVYVTFDASAASQPIAKVYYSTSEGGWNLIPNSPNTDEDWEYMIDFGTSAGGNDQTITLLVSNTGGSDLIITKSKPPEGTYLSATNPVGDLAEGLQIAPGKNITGSVYFEPPTAQLNSGQTMYYGAWTLNFNDLTWGVHVVNFTGEIEGAQVGPELASGAPRFQYLGCYLDSEATRIESSSVVSANNSIGFCQNKAYANTAAFAGVEYMDECYWGDAIPSSTVLATDANCEGYLCTGDSTQYCGGEGGYISIWYDVTAYFPENGTLGAGYQPPSMPQTVGDYELLGCYGDDSAARALTGLTPGLGSSTSLETCAAACAGYRYFGTEYSSECYCGNTINVESGTGVSGKLQTSGCTMLCAANQHEYCGGSSRLSMYGRNETVVSSTSASHSSSLTIISSSSAISSSSSAAASTPSSSSPVASTTTSTTPSPTASISCPNSNNTIYTAFNGARFVLECYLDRAGGDLAMDYVSSYAAACEACSTTTGCVALSWQPGINNPNYMKSSLVAGTYNTGVWGARLLTIDGPAALTESSDGSGDTLSITGRPVISIVSSSKSDASSGSSVASVTGRPVISLSSDSDLTSGMESTSIVTSASQAPSTHSLASIASSPSAITSTELVLTSTSGFTSLATSVSATPSAAKTASSPAAIASLSTPAGWSYAGCVNDSTTTRALQGPSLVNSGMTISMCTTYCSNKHFPYAGL